MQDGTQSPASPSSPFDSDRLQPGQPSPLDARHSPTISIGSSIAGDNERAVSPLTVPTENGHARRVSVAQGESRRGSENPSRRQRLRISAMQPRHIHRWKSPILIVVFFTIGLSMAVGHCLFYSSLNTRMVGDANAQENNIRMGTAFAFLSQISLCAACWLAYRQWIWKSIGKSDVSIQALNAIFSADTSIKSFLNREMWKKFTTASAMALLAWTLILPPFFTPATVFVYPSTKEISESEPVPYLTIGNSSAGHVYAYSPSLRGDDFKLKGDPTRRFMGPRTILTLLSTASMSFGRILDIAPQHNHSTYNLTFYGPSLRCVDADSGTAATIGRFLDVHKQAKLGTARQIENTYYAFIPTFTPSGEMVPQDQVRFQGPSVKALNQIWMTFLRYTLLSSGVRTRNRIYQVCSLFNATYDLRLHWDKGFQDVSGTATDLHEVPFPNDQPDTVSNMAQHAYSAYMWALTDQLVGSLGWFEDPECQPEDISCSKTFGIINTPIQHNSILGSSDLDVFFDMNEDLNNETFVPREEPTPQRRQDKELARNLTLDVLIEELAFNTTASFLHNPNLTNNVTTKVIRWDEVNRYGYQPLGLFIPYALGTSLTLLAVLLGLWSYWQDGVLPDKKFQDIVSAAEDPRVIHIIQDRRRSVTVEFVGNRALFRPGADL